MDILLRNLDDEYVITIDEPNKIKETIDFFIRNEIDIPYYELDRDDGNLKSLVQNDIVTIKQNPCSEDYCNDLDIIKIIRNGHTKCLYRAYELPEGKIKIDNLKWNRDTTTSICDIIAYIGNLDMLIWAISKNYKWGETTTRNAIDSNKYEIFKWTIDNGCPTDIYTCMTLGLKEDLNILEWAHSRGILSYTALEAAIKFNKFENVKWFCANGYKCSDEGFHLAARSGNLDMLKFLMKDGEGYNTETCSGAAKNETLEILKWLRDPKTGKGVCPWDKEACSAAAEHARLNNLKWLRAQGCDWDPDECLNEVIVTSLDVVKWIVSQGYKMKSSLYMNAVRADNLEALIWASDNGCEWDTKAYKFAVKIKSRQIINWLDNNHERLGYDI